MPKSYQIKTPLLKVLLQFYGNLSVQLYPVHYTNWRSLLNLTWNLLLLALLNFIMRTLYNDAFKAKYATPQLQQIYREKPLYSILMNLIMQHIFPICYLLNFLYFNLVSLTSSRLIIALDYFESVPFYREHPRTRICLSFSTHCLVYLLTTRSMVSIVAHRITAYQQVVLYFAFFTMNINANISFILINYYTVATAQRLQQIIANLKLTQNMAQFEADFTSLALVNRELNSLLSIPLLLNILPYAVQILTTSASIQVADVNISGSFMIQFGIPFGYMCYTQVTIQRQLRHLEAVLRTLSQGTSALFVAAFHLKAMSSLATQRYIQSLELTHLYGRYFTLKIFNLFTINWRFLFNLVLFILNYVVLVTQTSAG